MNTHYTYCLSTTLDSLNIYACILHIRTQCVFTLFVLFFVTKVNQKDIESIQFTNAQTFKTIVWKVLMKISTILLYKYVTAVAAINAVLLQEEYRQINACVHSHTKPIYKMKTTEIKSINCILNRKTLAAKLLDLLVSI